MADTQLDIGLNVTGREDAQGAADALNQLADAAGGAEQALSDAKDGGASFGDSLEKWTSIAEHSIEIAKNLYAGLEDLHDTAEQFENTQGVFELKGGQKGVEVLQQLMSYGQQVGLTMEQTNKVAQELGRKFDPSTALELTKVIGDVKANMHLTGEEAVNATGALARMADFTEVGARQARSLAEAFHSNVPTMEQISKATGMSVEQVTQLYDKGKLAPAALVAGFREAQQEIGGAVSAGQAGIAGAVHDPDVAFAKVSDSITKVKLALAGGIFGSDAAFEAATAFSKVADALLKLPGIIRDNSELFKALGIGVGVAAVAYGVTLLPELIATTVALGAAAAAAVVAAAPFIAIAAVAVGVYEAFTHWDKIKELAAGAWASVKQFASGAIESLKELPGQALELGKDLVLGLVKGIFALEKAPVDAILKVAHGAVSAFKGVLGISSPSKVFAEMGANTVEGFNQGVDAKVSGAQGSVQQLAQSVASAPAALPSHASPSPPSFAPSPGPQGGTQGASRSVTMNPVFNITVGPGVTQAQAQQAASTVKEEFLSMWHQLMAAEAY